MICPNCQKSGVQKTRMATYRRGSESVEVETQCWECPTCPDTFGAPHLQWHDRLQLMENDMEARFAWMRKFDKQMPPSEGWKPAPPPAPNCATNQKLHCFHNTNPFHDAEMVENGYHECLRCCFCGWTFCRSTTNAKIPEGHGPFIMDTKTDG